VRRLAELRCPDRSIIRLQLEGPGMDPRPSIDVSSGVTTEDDGNEIEALVLGRMLDMVYDE
jgi:hypothetical protein